MARTSRESMKNSSFFHIMVQGINKEYIFNTPKNMEKYLKLILENREDIQIIAYCIMGNHAHILIQTKDLKQLETWMKKSNTAYAMYYNQINDRVGYVFKNRYKVQLIKNIKHLYTCVKYIHDNPVKAKICETAAQYKFSSFSREYHNNDSEITDKLAEILNEFMNIEENNDSTFELIEDKEADKNEVIKEVVQKFLKDKKIDIQTLSEEKVYLIELSNILKYENQISYRMIAEYLNINRETLRRYIKQ